MAVLALTDAFAYVAGYDFTTDTNSLMLDMEADARDKTTFASSGWREFAGGLKSSKFDMEGFWQSATSQAVDPEAFPDLAVVNRVLTFGDVETEATVAYLAQLGKFSYELGGQLGELAPFKLGSIGTDGVGVVRGQLAKAKGDVSATGALGSILNLGAPTSTQYVYATFHVFGTPGTTITIQVQSDDGAGFATPTTRATIGPLTAAGGTWMTRVAGPFAGETHWRFNVSAITGTFTVAGAIGVQ